MSCALIGTAISLRYGDRVAAGVATALPGVRLHLEANKSKIHYFVREGRPWSNLSMPLSDQSSYGDKNQAWNRRILGLSSGAGNSLKAASRKEQEMVSGNPV